jgi:hypothetical protein
VAGVLIALLGSSAAAAPAGGPSPRTESCEYGAPPSSTPPTTPPPDSTAGAGCVAEPTSTGGGTGSRPGDSADEQAHPAHTPEATTGYHHLGAITDSGWGGVMGQVTVRHTGVRSGSDDFVATRFMARGDVGGQTKWLEVGWSEAGWQSGGPRLYTYDTNRNQWAYYGQYQVSDGMTIWLALDSDGATSNGTTTWDAWLWWNDRWNLLTAQRLPIPASTNLEQFVEVYDDPARGGTFAVPPIAVSGVQVTPAGGGYQPWTGGVGTNSAPADTGYCLAWRTPYDSWAAGSSGC